MVGLGLTLLGAAAALLSIFLPLSESASFSSVADNTLIQSGSGIEFIVLAIWIAVLSYRYVRRGNPGWGVLVVATLIVATAVYYALSDRLFVLYSLDPATGARLTDGPAVRASVGIALYVAGFGGVMAFVGGWLMWKHSDVVADKTVAQPARSQEMKRCPDCAEDVRAEARVCRFCGYVFPSSETQELVATWKRHQRPERP